MVPAQRTCSEAMLTEYGYTVTKDASGKLIGATYLNKKYGDYYEYDLSAVYVSVVVTEGCSGILMIYYEYPVCYEYRIYSDATNYEVEYSNSYTDIITVCYDSTSKTVADYEAFYQNYEETASDYDTVGCEENRRFSTLKR